MHSFSILPFFSISPSESISISTPLLRNSYLPLFTTRTQSSETGYPSTASATLTSFSLATCLLSSKTSLAGTKESSNPFGVTKSTSLPRKCLHSFDVISLTVVKTSASVAEIFSRDCLATTLNSLATCSKKL